MKTTIAILMTLATLFGPVANTGENDANINEPQLTKVGCVLPWHLIGCHHRQ